MTFRPWFFAYLLVMVLVTYCIRMLPLVLVKHKITNRFLLSFLYYMPYAVLAVMTVPAIFTATDHTLATAVGFCVAAVLAFFRKSLITVAVSAVASVLAMELLCTYVFLI